MLQAIEEVETDNCSFAGQYGDDVHDEEEAIILARKEDRAVSYLRLLVTVLLAMVAMAVSLSVYFVAKRTEKQDFEEDFSATSDQVVATFGSTMKHRFEILENFAIDMTSRVDHDPSLSWPFVTFPDFGVRAGKTARIGVFLDITLFPVVEEAQLQQWNNFSMENDFWIPESISLLEGTPIEEIQYPPVGPLSSFVKNDTKYVPVTPEVVPGPYMPQWLTFPATRSPLINTNAASFEPFGKSSATALAVSKPVFTQSFDAFDEPPGSVFTSVVTEMVAKAQGGTFENDAIAPIFYPVFDRISDTAGTNKTVKALIRAGIYWRAYLQDILPARSEGIIVVLENNCDNVYTYQIDGSEAHCLGRGDHHDPKYDYLETSVTVGSFLELDESEEAAMEGHCSYGLRVYPSRKLESSYMTKMPPLFALLLGAVFCLTAATFILYDYCVQRRQRIVVKAAQQSGRIVQSLFPEAVRYRLYEEQDAKDEKSNTKCKKDGWSKVDGNSNHGSSAAKSGANASLYPECTVIFADIAGFTKWSSTRPPYEVFDLLESIYGAFDAVAKRRHVFKIETIGDCYVAVTGLPEHQPQHSVIMVKFANDCRKKFHELIHDDLIGRLGAETALLGMRFGIHSGPVTAGVLCGEKARFQIFGDSVNVAARMESNGLRDKIHLSEQTAELLTKAGKGSWLVKRDELVAVKGKGDMQTFWANVPSGSNFATDTSVSTESQR